MKSARQGLARFVAFSAFAAGSGALAFAAMGAQGCTITSGDGDASDFSFDSGATGSDSGTPIQGDPACNECLFEGCNGQWAVCQQSTDCIAIYQCATKAGCDQACVTSCFNDHPGGQKEYTALYTCDQAAACTQACVGPCKTAPDSCYTPPDDAGQPPADSGSPPLDCHDCTTQRCSTETASCAAGSDCDKFSQCVTACQDLACIDTCNANFAQGKTNSEALANCTSAQCATECGL